MMHGYGMGIFNTRQLSLMENGDLRSEIMSIIQTGTNFSFITKEIPEKKKKEASQCLPGFEQQYEDVLRYVIKNGGSKCITEIYQAIDRFKLVKKKATS